MAHLDDRGQIILVAAFVLAVTFVALAVVANSAIFTENLASRGDTAGGDEALLTGAMVEENVGEVLTSANRNNYTDPDPPDATTTAADNLTWAVDNGTANVSTRMERQQARSGVLLSVGHEGERNGRRIGQETSPQESFDDGGDTAYLLAGDVERVATANGTRAFRANVSVADLATSNGTAFEIKANRSGATGNQDSWRLRLWDDGGDVHVRTLVNDGGTTRQNDCVVGTEGSHAVVDVTGGRVDGTPCEALGWNSADENFRFGAGAGGSYDVYFRNADRATGNYSLVVHDDGGLDVPNLDSLTGTGQPYEATALYDVTVRYRYTSTGIRYETDVRVAPGEPDA